MINTCANNGKWMPDNCDPAMKSECPIMVTQQGNVTSPTSAKLTRGAMCINVG